MEVSTDAFETVWATVTFSRRALDRLYEYSGGVPRVINLLCDRALMAGAQAGAMEIAPAHVEGASATLLLQEDMDVSGNWERRKHRCGSSMTIARLSPDRTISDEAFDPASRPSASTIMDFPAPVSPERRLKPCSK